jgi:hypothetical protein
MHDAKQSHWFGDRGRLLNTTTGIVEYRLVSSVLQPKLFKKSMFSLGTVLADVVAWWWVNP